MRSILIADDNPHAQRMGSQILGQAGHKVFTLSNGDQVYSFISEHHPDVAILDLRMPGVSGVDLCVKIKADQRLDSTKVLLLAGPLDNIDSREVEHARSDGVIQKPLDAHTLTTMIDRLFDGAMDAVEESVNQAPERPVSLVDPPPPPPRVFTGNGAPNGKVAAPNTPPKVNGSPPPVPPPANGSQRAGARQPVVVQSAPVGTAPAPWNARQPLEIVNDEIMEEISDVVLGAMAPAPPKFRPIPRENGHAAAAAHSNGINGHNGNGKTLDPFAALVEHALGYSDHDTEFESRVAQIVDEVVQGAMHTIRERITHEVISTYRRIAV